MNKTLEIEKIAVLNAETISANEKYAYINYLDTSSITNNRIESFQYLESNFPSRAKRKVKANTIIYSTVRPNQEHFGFFKDVSNIGNIIVSTGFTTIDVISKEVDSQFLYYILTQKWVTNYLQTIGESAVSAYPSINPSDLAKLRFSFPDVYSQQKIAGVLSAFDNKIELNIKINAELEALAKTLYDYWFLQFDFPDENGRPYKSSGGKMVYNDVLKREIPKGWEVKKFGELAIIKAGGDKPKVFSLVKTELCTIPVYSNGIINEGLYGFTDKATINCQSLTISARGTIGYCVLRNKAFVPIIRLITITPFFQGSAKYFEFYVKALTFERSGSVQQQLPTPLVSSIQILSPPISILQKFAALTSPLIKQIEILKEQNQELSSLRGWLLPMLMNGQVRVGKTYEEEEEVLSMAAEDQAPYQTKIKL